MTTPPGPGSLSPRRLLAASGTLVAVPVLTVGGLLFALSQEAGPRVAGLLLVAAGVVAAAAGFATLRRPAAARRLLSGAAAVLVAAGVVAVLLVAARGAVFLLDLLIVGGVPVMGALVLGLMTRLADPQAGDGG